MKRLVIGAITLLLAAAVGPRADASDLKVLSTGNMSTILGELSGEFERTSGHKLVIEYGSTTRMRDRILAGEAADVTINEIYVLEDLLRQDRLAEGTMVRIARSPFAVGIRTGAPKPDVSSTDALKRTLLAADSIAQPNAAGGAQDGAYFVGLIARLGIADALKPKIKITQGGDAAAKLVLAGGAQLGVAQRRNFISLKGVEPVEPLPDLPGMKFRMAGAVVAGTHEREGAMALLRFLSSAAITIRARGMEPYAQ
jgi:molybdate transport system substrate-binding protein